MFGAVKSLHTFVTARCPAIQNYRFSKLQSPFPVTVRINRAGAQGFLQHARLSLYQVPAGHIFSAFSLLCLPELRNNQVMHLRCTSRPSTAFNCTLRGLVLSLNQRDSVMVYTVHTRMYETHTLTTQSDLLTLAHHDSMKSSDSQVNRSAK